MPRVRCAKAECKEPPSPPSTKFCAKHRREHGQMLLAQLERIERNHG
jgi:hypothetical protein